MFFKFFVLQRLVFNSDSDRLEEPSFAHVLIVPRKTFITYDPSMLFLKNLNFHFLGQIQTSNVSFSFILYFRDLFFSKLKWIHLNKSFFAQFLVVTRKFLPPLAHARILLKKIIILPIFHPNRDFKRCFSLFSYFRYLFLKYDSYPLQEFFLAHLLVVTRKKITSCGASMLFLKNK